MSCCGGPSPVNNDGSEKEVKFKPSACNVDGLFLYIISYFYIEFN